MESQKARLFLTSSGKGVVLYVNGKYIYSSLENLKQILDNKRKSITFSELN
jgi:hypothetical protein